MYTNTLKKGDMFILYAIKLCQFECSIKEPLPFLKPCNSDIEILGNSSCALQHDKIGS